MGIFSRMSDIINANINTMLDKAEDPEKIVRLMIQEMEDTLVEVRSAAARAIADKKELQRRLEKLGDEQAEWERKAELAVSKGRDDLAKAALAEKARIGRSAEALGDELEHVDEALGKFNQDIAQLQEKLSDAKARQKAMVVRHNTASRRLQVRERIHDTRIDDAMLRFDQFERKMDDMEGRIEAYDMGRSEHHPLERAFDELEGEADAINEELEALKKRVSSGEGTGAKS